MALSGSISTNAWYSSNNGHNYYVVLNWSATQNIANNTSTISWNLKLSTAASGYITVGEVRLKFGDTQIYYHDESKRRTYYNGDVINSGTKTMTHNSDGSLSFTAYVEAGIYEWSINKSGSGIISLNQIPRQASITAAPSFNDEGNPTISYSNPAGNAVSALDACISLTGATDDIKYRAITKTGSSYTFNLTTAERNVLRNACTTSNSRTVMFFVRTTIGSTVYHSSLSKTLTIVNANPTLTVDAVDTNETTKALTGDAHKYIRYYSNVSATATATALKGATIKSTTGAGTFNKTTKSSYSFKTTDSRGNSTSKTYTGTLIPYIYLTANFKPRISVSGEAQLHVKGNYFNGSFGATSNTLTLQYRYKKGSGSYTSWTGYTPSISGNTHDTTIKFNISSFDYKAKYTFQVRVIDKLATITPSAYTTSAEPVFDWSADDFKFNVPVAIAGNLVVSGTITQNNDPVAIDVDVPYTDYVVGYGTIDGWTYRKWNSGTLECWRRIQITANVASAWGALYTSGAIASTNLTYPVAFTETPVLNVNLSTFGSGAFLLAPGGSSYTSATQTGPVEIVRGTSLSNGQYLINYYAIGKYK